MIMIMNNNHFGKVSSRPVPSKTIALVYSFNEEEDVEDDLKSDSFLLHKFAEISDECDVPSQDVSTWYHTTWYHSSY